MAEPGEILPESNVDMAALYDSLRRSKSSAEETVAKMLAAKKGVEPKTQLRELVTQILLNFVSLRQANRSILIEEDRVKAETERAKAPVDLTTLQLHNLMYEKNHYVKAIKACKDFKTKYPHIDLVPEEEFFEDAPEEIKNSALSTDESHNLMLKRLNYEHFQRKELCKLHEKLELKKKALQETIANRKKFLSSLPSHLKALKKASLPVQHQLGVLHTKKLKQHQLAELLPPPLYVIYTQLLAQKEAFGENIELEITGSVKDAQAFARQLANKDSAISTTLENSKLEDDAPEEEDDGQRRRKRPKKILNKENLEQSGMYQNHPLKVILQIDHDEASHLNSGRLITLKFEFLIRLNAVCVGVEGSEDPHNSILCNLFPNDTGLELPEQSAKLRMGISHSFDKMRTSRPYKWAQHLAGIDFLPEVSPLAPDFPDNINRGITNHASVLAGLSVYRQQNRVQTVVQRIRSRKKAQLALVELLDLLRKLKFPALTCDVVPWTSHKQRCNLLSWLALTSSVSSVASTPIADGEQVQGPASGDDDRKNGMSGEGKEITTEDGELLSLVPVAAGVPDATPSKGSELDNSGSLSFMSKSIMSPITKGKSPSFKKLEEDVDLLMESDNELEEPIQAEEISDSVSGGSARTEELWADCGIQEYSLVLIRKLDNNQRNVKLESKIKISVEYPLRPPRFELTLYSSSQGGDYSEAISSEFFNELRAMEAEVNVHLMKMIPLNQENLVLGHQVLCLAMLFDFFMDDGDLSSEKRCTSVIDVGLCKPVSGELVSRSFRGRDRRKMISWKDKMCTSGYPY